METITKTDEAILSDLNEQFIRNFINQDTVAHDEIIHKDFVCIYSTGAVIDRDTYMKDWSQGYTNSKYTSFDYTDESIRVFGDMALVMSKTVYTKTLDGQTVHGNTVYTDTYVKENGRWWCVQVQLTAVSKGSH